MRLSFVVPFVVLAACQSLTPAVVDEGTDASTPDGDASSVDGGVHETPDGEVAYTGEFGASSGVYMLTVAGRVRTVRVHVPPGVSASPALMLGFHGTNGSAEDFENETRIAAASDELGFVSASMQAEDMQGVAANADHQSPDLFARMWDIVDRNPATNRDLLYTRAVIQEAQRALHVDAGRVYLVGHSNGGFFVYHAAATMPSRVAGFATSCSGVVRCGYRAACSFVGGAGTTCAALRAAAGFCAQTCDPSTSLMAPLPSGRMPRAFLAHGNRDDIVSVAFTCQLAAELGDRAEVQIVDGLTHALAPDFVRGAWRRLSPFTASD